MQVIPRFESHSFFLSLQVLKLQLEAIRSCCCCLRVGSSTARSSYGHLMVVPSLVRCDEMCRILRRPLHILAHGTLRVGASVVASATTGSLFHRAVFQRGCSVVSHVIMFMALSERDRGTLEKCCPSPPFVHTFSSDSHPQRCQIPRRRRLASRSGALQHLLQHSSLHSLCRRSS